MPAALAVISAVPTASPVTFPSASTVATAAFPLCHEISIPEIKAPVSSSGSACIVTTKPIGTSDESGDTRRDTMSLSPT